MRDGYYTDPKYQRVQPKIAVVITFFDTVQNYGHFSDNKLETLKMNLRAHAHFDPGVEYELMIVNHSDRMIPEDVLAKYYPGPGIQIHKDNFGYSFGGYKQAWQEFGSKYDFYCFTEDDIAPAKDGWLKEILTKFMEKSQTGAVGNFVEGRSRTENGSDLIFAAAGSTRDMMYNFDGAFTFTSSKILREIDSIGGLKVMDTEPATDIPGTVNEAIFQEQILELGYHLLSFADGEYFVVHGSEIFTNDVSLRIGSICPLMNLNGRHKIPEIAELYKFLND